jgi:cell division control protein 45
LNAGNTSLGDESSLPASLSSTAEKGADGKSIHFIEDFQLVLLRHWNLYDSLFHSTYVATKLGVWKEKGRQRLTNLLVKMG